MRRKPDSPVVDARRTAERLVGRARDVLAEGGRALVRATDERQLLHDMCRIAVERGGYSMACVALAHNDAQRTLEPVASEGRDDGYLASMRFSWSDDDQHGRGPAGVAVRSGKSQLIRDISTDPKFAPWREAALERGYRAVAALPLKSEGETFGVFAIYAGEPGAFDAGEVALLEELADDIAYGVANLRRRLAQQRAEAAIESSERRLRATLDLVPVGINHIDVGGRILFANPQMARILGYVPDELVGRSIGDFVWPADAEPRRELHERRAELHAGRIERIAREIRYRHKDGYPVWVGLTIALQRDSLGRPLYDISAVEDIGARKRDEQLLELGYAVSLAIAEAGSEAAAVRAIIRAICEKENWECGRYWRVDECAGLLRLRDSWCVAGSRFEEFFEQWSAVTYARGQGLAGMAWQSGEPQWACDITQDTRVGQKLLALRSGMRGVFAFPVKSECETLGVLVFNSVEARERKEELVQAIGAIGSQIGQFLRRMRAEEDLRRFRLAMDHSADMILLIDRASMRFIDVNRTTCELLGYSREELLGMGPAELIPMERAELERQYDALIADPATPSGMKSSYRCKDGSRLPFESTRRVLRSGGSVIIAAISRDIRERLAAESALMESEQRMRAQAERQRLVAELGQHALASDDLAGVLESAAELVAATLKTEFSDILEHEPEPGGGHLVYRAGVGWPAQWVGRRTVALRPGDPLDRILSRGEPLVTPDYVGETGFVAPEDIAALGIRASVRAPIFGSHGAFGLLAAHSTQPRRFSEDEVNFLRSVANILAVAIERKRAEERLAHLAQFDPLTGLPNRHLFHDRLNQTLAHAKRGGHSMAMLFIDLDRFKLVNDTLGHAGGDKLLREAAARLQGCLRSGDTVARFGGDEFGAILTELGASGDAGLVAQKIIEALQQPFLLDGNEVYVTASVGITVFPADGEDAGTLIMNSDAAMYRAKEQGRDNYQYFTREMNERARARLQMEAALRRAVEQEEFRLHYQPKLALLDGRVCGMEALLRWGDVAPAEFIPVLEDSGLIVPVGEWVMREVCRQIRTWKGVGLAVPPVAVNLSARQFQQKDLESRLRETLQEAAIDPSMIQLELTESLLMKDPEAAARTLRGLKRAGVRISVDDFGTGYSSLAYLKRFPIDELKIDRAFVQDVTTNADDAAIVASIIGLAHGLKLRVVAEGVETQDQVRFLRSHGCDEMQGYYSARPAAGEGLEALLRAGGLEL